MTVFDNRTTKKDHYTKSKNKHYLRPQLDVCNKKIRTKSNSRQIKFKQNSLTYTSLEKNGTGSQCDWLTGQRKSKKK